VGFDLEDLKRGGPKMGATIGGDLYPVLNRMGALLINAQAYEEDNLSLNKYSQGIKSITVNPNHLHEFSVNDTHGNPVQVSEDTSDWILLVPEKYHDQEQEILSFFHKAKAVRARRLC
jgi:putative ABC transport system permease protein